MGSLGPCLWLARKETAYMSVQYGNMCVEQRFTMTVGTHFKPAFLASTDAF